MPSVWQILSWTLALITVVAVAPARAQEVTVFDVRKNLPMSDDEPVYRDFYINAGSNAGIKSGMIITVIRKRALYDPYQNNNPSDLSVPVGELKVIHVQKDMSVARLHRTFDRDNMPILEFNFILVGDRLDLGTAHFGGGEKSEKAKAPTKSAAAETPIMVPKKPQLAKPFESMEFASSKPVPGDEQAPVEMPVQN